MNTNTDNSFEKQIIKKPLLTLNYVNNEFVIKKEKDQQK